jgi:hypothetical protein
MIRGEAVHKLAEHFLLDDIPNVPKDLEKFRTEFIQIKKLQADAEIDLSVTSSWKPTTATDWSGVWLRTKIDARVRVETESSVIDFKTGKIYGDNQDQNELYAVTEMCHSPEVDTVDTELWYLDSGDVVSQKFHRKDLSKMKAKWSRRVKPMFTLTEGKMTPSHMCKWCPLAKDSGGNCIYNRNGDA